MLGYSALLYQVGEFLQEGAVAKVLICPSCQYQGLDAMFSEPETPKEHTN
jgi:hypothetical protein